MNHCCKLFFRAAALALAAVISVSAFAISPAAAEPTQDLPVKTENTVGTIADGYYHIRNVGTGKYLDTYDLIYDAQGTAYLDRATGQNGQDLYVSRNTDGSYTITPQSDGAKYVLSYATGNNITKAASAGKNESFHILPASENAFAIAPAYAADPTLVIGASSLRTWHGFTRVALSSFSSAANQLWNFEAVPVTGISMAYTEVRERLYSVGKYYATTAPYPVPTEAMVWSSDNEAVLLIDADGSWCAIGVGTAKVTVSCGDMSVSCRVEVVDSPSYAFYSQHDIDGTYWNGSALKGIYFTYGVTKRYAVDRYNRNTDWMDEGCALTAHAICLRNLGATMTHGYDFRSGQNGSLPADPYTVSLANSGNNGATSPNETLYGNPILVNHNLIATRFTLDGKPLTCTQTYAPTLKQIKEALDLHPEGVIVGMYNRVYENHYLLFTKCVNPEETNPNKYKFIVCDPAAYTPDQGDNVPFEKCYSYVSLGYRYSGATCMLTWNVSP